MNRILIVRLGSLGDIVHAIPVAAALREALPQARIDWLVDARNREILELVPVLDRRVVLDGSGSVPRVVARLRRERYDVALDLQGLLKSAVLARLSGARRVVGFSSAHLREPSARVFYTDRIDPRATSGGPHVIQKNLGLIEALGVAATAVRFPIVAPSSDIDSIVRQRLGLSSAEAFALINPGAAWPNKRWPAERFGAVARVLADRHRLRSLVLWGPGEEPLAYEVARQSADTARVAPQTTVADLVTLSNRAALMVSGDTGPLHIAAAMGTPLVGIYGPTSPARNGPWAPGDVTVSRFAECACHHLRRCRARRWCLLDISIDQVADAIARRLAVARAHA